VRNSSLVEWRCAENITGLKLATEAMGFLILSRSGRGALSQLRSFGVSQGGAVTSENVGMSSVKACENHAHRKPKVSYATSIGVGLARPKPNPNGAGDGQWVNIPMLLSFCFKAEGGPRKVG
jgi:hypothetical protein